MKIKTVLTVVGTTVAIVAAALTTLVLFSLPPTTAISPFVEERNVPLMQLPDVDLELQNFSNINMTVNDYETLPDNHVFLAGQSMTSYGVYWPSFQKLNFGAGAAWTSGLSLNYDDGTEYLPNGTDVNEFTDVIYVSDTEIYLIGTVRGQLETTLGNFVPLGGFFDGYNIPASNDIYTFIFKASTSASLQFLGFLSDVNEEGTQETFITSATASASNRLLLTGMTNAHSGVLENLSDESMYEFAIELDTSSSIQLLRGKAFDGDLPISPYRIQSLDNGDVLVMGFYEEAIPSINLADPQSQYGISAVLRLEADAWDVLWATSSEKVRTLGVETAMYNRFIELTDHSLIATATAMVEGGSNLMITYLEEDGTVIDQRLIQPNADFSPEYFFKGESGYVVLGTALGDGEDNTNLQLVQLDDWFNFKSKKTLIASGEEILNGEPEVTYNDRLMMLIAPSALDGDFTPAAAYGSNNPLVALYITPQL